MKFLLSSQEDLIHPIKFVRDKILHVSRGIIPINGEMGAGKTTFISHLVKSFSEKTIVNSPTYNLIHEYRLPDERIFYHFDLYRVKSPEDAGVLGFEDIWGKKGISFIEWPGVGRAYYENVLLEINIQVLDDGKRMIEIKDP